MNSCEECDLSFSDASNLRRHMLSKHGKGKPFKCEICNHSFTRSDHLKRHAKTHEETKETIPCAIEGCKRVFTSPDAHVEHLAWHKKKLEDDAIYIKGMLVEKVTHEDSTSYQCPFDTCKKLYDSYSGVHKHISRHLTDTLPLKIDKTKGKTIPECKICLRLFRSKSSLRRHNHKVHATGKESKELSEEKCVGYHCPHEGCLRILSSPSNVRAHVKTVHEGLKRFYCDCCGVRYKWKRSLDRHKCKGISRDSEKGSQSSQPPPQDE